MSSTFESVSSENKEIEAAGGVVIRRSRDQAQVLLVHRPRYDDWSIPKGKLHAGESVEAGALREVEEETGLTCRIVMKLTPIRYEYVGRQGESKPKIVHFFLMEPVGGEVKMSGEEVDEAAWLSPSEAAGQVSYETDRLVLEDALRTGLIS